MNKPEWIEAARKIFSHDLYPDFIEIEKNLIEAFQRRMEKENVLSPAYEKQMAFLQGCIHAIRTLWEDRAQLRKEKDDATGTN